MSIEQLKFKEIAGRLQQRRKELGFKSARVFARYFDIAESTYAQHESGKRKINLKTLFAYSSFLKINPAWLLCGQGSSEISLESISIDKTKSLDIATLKNILKVAIPKIKNFEIKSATELVNIIESIHHKSKNKEEIKHQMAEKINQ